MLTKLQLNLLGTTVIHQCIESSSNRSSGKQDIVDQNNVDATKAKWQVGWPNFRSGQSDERVVAVERDVYSAQRRTRALDTLD